MPLVVFHVMLKRFGELGLTRTARVRALGNGELSKVAHGWYVSGPAGELDERWLQQLIAHIGQYPDGRLAGPAAAALMGLDGFDPGATPVLYRPPGVSARGRSVRRLEPLADPVDIAGLAVCGVDELLVGLGAEVVARPGCAAASTSLDPVELLELAVESALRRGLTSIERLQQVVAAARPNRPGRALLIQLLAHRPEGAPPTESYLETRFVQVARAAGLPDFERQVTLADDDGPIGRVDFCRELVVVEIVGAEWHLDRFHRDHDRYARLGSAGYHLLPFTFQHVERRPRSMVRTTATALSLGPARPPPRGRDTSCRRAG